MSKLAVTDMQTIVKQCETNFGKHSDDVSEKLKFLDQEVKKKIDSFDNTLTNSLDSMELNINRFGRLAKEESSDKMQTLQEMFDKEVRSL